jgi:SAM-dependent methyltransferase
MSGLSDPAVQQRMREDWDRRAREDACYYVAFGRRRQSAEEFFSTAGEVLHALRAEFERWPPATDFRSLSALEIGCGPGRLLVPLSQIFGRITGVDVSPEMIEMARRNLAGISHAGAEVASGSDLAAFADDSFDFCYSYAVFQHIPSREVVLHYLREAWRVLKPGSILKCQLNGLPDRGPGQPDTWSGVRFRPEEIRAFCREHDFQLLELAGIDTQNMWMAAAKRPRGWCRFVKRAPGRLTDIGNTFTTDPVVPASGRYSSASLWVERLTPDADINNLEVEIACAPGPRALPCYVGNFPWKRLAQVNVFLPSGTPTGLTSARLWMLGEPITNFSRLRVVPAPPRMPRLLGATDGINLLSGPRIETRSLKVDLEEAGCSPAVTVTIDGLPVDDLDVCCVDPLPERYVASMKVPAAIGPGSHLLQVRLNARVFPPLSIEIADEPARAQ